VALDLTKEYQTRSGQKVRYIAQYTPYPNEERLLYIRINEDGSERIGIVYTNGRQRSDDIPHDYDLVEVRKKITVDRWIAVYACGRISPGCSSLCAVRNASPKAMAYKHIVFEIEEGENVQ